jgi:tRNA(Ile)-lysidine synthase
VTVSIESAALGLVAPVVVGCSGGADSLALVALSADAGLDPVAVHVDHGLRPGSHREAAVVRAQVERVGARFDALTVDVGSGPNLEARARDARYRALDGSRRRHGATAVLVAHTADDQAETVLLNVLRGAAASGLGGMRVRHGHVVRPLLGTRRAELRAYCEARGLEPFHDPTNADRTFRRAAVRHDVLPLLEKVAARDLVPVLARQAEVLAAESDFLDALAAAAWPDADPPHAAGLLALPDVLARRAVRGWLGPPPASQAEVARVLAVARGECRAAQLAGGRTVRRSRGRMYASASR